MTDIYPFVLVNGDIRPKGSLSFPFSDYGFIFGYGLFETLLISNKKPLLFKEHFKRLQDSAILLDIPSLFDIKTMENAIHDLISKNHVEEGILNLYLTPGDRPVHTRKVEFEASFFLGVIRPVPFTGLYRNPLHIVVKEVSVQRIKMDRLKSMSFFKNIFERRLYYHYDDVLLCNKKQNILETPSANVFFVQDDVLITPKSSYILPGIVRQFIVTRQLQFGYSLLEKEVKCEDLDFFDEIFLTNSLGGVILVESVENYPRLSSKSISMKIKNIFHKMVYL